LQVRKADFNNDQYVQDFGISINDRMVELEGRVLQAPKLQYGGKVGKPIFCYLNFGGAFLSLFVCKVIKNNLNLLSNGNALIND